MRRSSNSWSTPAWRSASIPHRSFAPSLGPELSRAVGKAILSWGSFRLCLTFRLHTFFVTFILAPVSRPILFLDFLAAHYLLVNPVAHLVLDAKKLRPISNVPATSSSLPFQGTKDKGKYCICWWQGKTWTRVNTLSIMEDFLASA